MREKLQAIINDWEKRIERASESITAYEKIGREWKHYDYPDQHSRDQAQRKQNFFERNVLIEVFLADLRKVIDEIPKDEEMRICERTNYMPCPYPPATQNCDNCYFYSANMEGK
jgi:hypothetical protein